MDRKSFEELVEESSGLNGHSHTNGHDLLMEPDGGFELTDEIDHEILMHRDAHFGGDFNVMLQYYEEDGIGVNPDFDFERIVYLKEVEDQIDGNLAALVLSIPEAERVAKARATYTQLKEVYEGDNDLAKLVADLILCEEEDPEELIEEILEMNERIIPDLIRIVESADAYDPLSPGYGLAPALAIHCLGELREARAVVLIFERFGSEMLFDEEILLEALQKIGEPAKQFLLRILKSRPITSDNIHAAFALTSFAQDTEIAICAYEELQSPEICDKPLLSTYLLCHCDALQRTAHRENFIAMARDSALPRAMRLEIENIVRDWK